MLVVSYTQVGYARIMGTRPQTLYGLADSPVGGGLPIDHGDVAACCKGVIEWSTSEQGLMQGCILANITLYWLTNLALSAVGSTGNSVSGS